MKGVEIQYDSSASAQAAVKDEYDSEDEFEDFRPTRGPSFDNHPYITVDKAGYTVLNYASDEDEDDLGLDRDSDSDNDSDGDDESYGFDILSDDIAPDDEGEGEGKHKAVTYLEENYEGIDDQSKAELAELEAEDEEEEDELGGWSKMMITEKPRDDVETYYFRDFVEDDYDDYDDEEPSAVKEEGTARVSLLAPHGDDVGSFLDAIIEHPTKFAEVRRYNTHPDSLRGAKPINPPDRHHPSVEFVTSHRRFLFVSNLPHYIDEDGQVGDFDNPLHRQEVANAAAEQFGVKVSSVSPASMTSAFVGFKSRKAARAALEEGPKNKTITKPFGMEAHEGDELYGFEEGDALVKLVNVRPDMGSAELEAQLIPQGSDLASVYDKVEVKKILATEAIVKLGSAEQAESMLTSAIVRRRLEELGTTQVRHFKAKRILVYAGKVAFADRQYFQRQGNRLMVSHDIPSDHFYQSHVGVLKLVGVNSSVTKQELTDLFQPFCRYRRDSIGSIEFGTCAANLRSGNVFVGFDYPEEMVAAGDHFHAEIKNGEGKSRGIFAGIHKMKDRHVPGAVRRELRSDRSREEILESLNWENYVSPEDIKILEDSGIDRQVIANAFITMRMHNRSYGPMDWSMTTEKDRPDRLNPGDHMRETMDFYVNTLKECIPTRENPGALFQAIHLPDEELDYSLIDGKKT